MVTVMDGCLIGMRATMVIVPLVGLVNVHWLAAPSTPRLASTVTTPPVEVWVKVVPGTVEVVLTTVKPFGSTSVIVTPLALDGPAFANVMV